MAERILENEKNEKVDLLWNENFIDLKSRPVSLGLSDFHKDRPLAGGEDFEILPGRVCVGRIDTTRYTLK